MQGFIRDCDAAYKNRLRRIEAPHWVGLIFDLANNRSHSLECFRYALRELVGHA